MELTNAPGTRDYLPEEKIGRQKIIDTIRRVFENYGYSPFETPAIERYDILASKYAGGAEILKETFKFKDQGNRELALRYDLTVPLARVIGQNPTIKMPFKRYQIEKVWRDGPISAGRYREFWQADVDIVGCSLMTADAEMVMIAQDVFDSFRLKSLIRVNNRKILDGIAEIEGITNLKEKVIIALDKLDKIGNTGVLNELQELGFDANKAEEVLKIFSIKGPKAIEELRWKLNEKESQSLREGIAELESMAQLCKHTSFEIDISLARGMSYYTGTIIEVVLPDNKIKSSVAGGGRYDKMIPLFLSTDKPYPAVGISFGVDRIYDALDALETKAKAKTLSEVYVIHFKNYQAGFDICKKLRKLGIKCDMDLSDRGPSKNLEYANQLGMRFVIFAGAEELEHNKVKLKDMKSGNENLLPFKEAAEAIIRARNE